MPMVRRRIRQDNETLHGSSIIEHDLYVKRTQIKKGDRILDPKELTNKQIADLAARYPDDKQGKQTFAELAQTRKVRPIESGVARFLDASKEEALEMIADETDVETVAEWLAAEEKQRKPRRAVLAALEERIDELADGDDDEEYIDLDEDELEEVEEVVEE
jgi:hypothetical protein